MPSSPMTAEELLAHQPTHTRAELVRGRMVVREPGGFEHGRIAMRAALLLHDWLREHPIGELLAAETGFTLARDPDTVRAPDVAFLRAERVPSPAPRGFAEMAPDLAIEVLSPDARRGEVAAKFADWLDAGATAVWIIDPMRRVGQIHRAGGELSLVHPGDAFRDDTLLPGFALPLDLLFA
ncbi:MAG: Uma2 family endonuclease [Gemmatimonadaceae bacterium]|nr:Uma2 family endonuclease [Gemmatimonadaceae bacterium]